MTDDSERESARARTGANFAAIGQHLRVLTGRHQHRLDQAELVITAMARFMEIAEGIAENVDPSVSAELYDTVSRIAGVVVVSDNTIGGGDVSWPRFGQGAGGGVIVSTPEGLREALKAPSTLGGKVAGGKISDKADVAWRHWGLEEAHRIRTRNRGISTADLAKKLIENNKNRDEGELPDNPAIEKQIRLWQEAGKLERKKRTEVVRFRTKLP